MISDDGCHDTSPVGGRTWVSVKVIDDESDLRVNKSFGIEDTERERERERGRGRAREKKKYPVFRVFHCSAQSTPFISRLATRRTRGDRLVGGEEVGLGGESENGSESWKQSTFLWPPEKSTFFVRRRGRERERPGVLFPVTRTAVTSVRAKHAHPAPIICPAPITRQALVLSLRGPSARTDRQTDRQTDKTAVRSQRCQ